MSLNSTSTQSEIRAAVSRYGTVTTFHYNQAPRGWALVTFDSSEEANAAVSELNERTVFSACQGPIVCRIAHEKKPGEKKSAQSATAASSMRDQRFL